jgi:hypothetical protein
VQRAIWTGLALVALGVSISTAQDSGKRAKRVTFDVAVERLVSAVRKAAPKGVRCEIKTAAPEALGWKAPKNTPARVLTIMTPSGGAVAFGLMPRKGTLEPIQKKWPRLVAIGKRLVVVEGPQPEVAMTMDAMEKAQQLLREATAPIYKAAEGDEVQPKHRPETLAAAKKVVKYPHYLGVDLAPGQTLDEKAVRAMGYTAVAYRVVPEKGPPPAPIVKVLTEAKSR